MNFFKMKPKRKSSFSSKEFLEILDLMGIDEKGRKRLTGLSREQKQILLENYRKLERNGYGNSDIAAGGMAGPVVDDDFFLDLLSKQNFTPPEIQRHLDFTDDQKQEFYMKHLNDLRRSASSTPKSTICSKFNQNYPTKDYYSNCYMILGDDDAEVDKTVVKQGLRRPCPGDELILKSQKILKPFQWDLLTKDQANLSPLWKDVFTSAYEKVEEYLDSDDQLLLDRLFLKEELVVKALPSSVRKITLINPRNSQNIGRSLN
jgi:hypothetical protein